MVRKTKTWIQITAQSNAKMRCCHQDIAKSIDKISNHNNNEQWNSLVQQINNKKTKYKQKQCYDCLTEAYLHKLFRLGLNLDGKPYKNHHWIKC